MIREWKWALHSMNHPLKLLLLVSAGSWWLQPVTLGCSGLCRRLDSDYTWVTRDSGKSKEVAAELY